MMNAWDKAKRMRMGGIGWGTIAARTGISEYRLRCEMQPGFREMHQNRVRQSRERNRQPPGETHRVEIGRLSPRETLAALASIPKDTRNLTAKLCGDPLPGRSALDRSTGFPHSSHQPQIAASARVSFAEN